MRARRLSVWLVSPAWRRLVVSRIAFAQRAHLIGELAARGIDCQAVVISDDENLELAREYGFDTIQMDNDSGLGRRFNAGYQHAAAHGADYMVHIGSDDWLHPDAFNPLFDPEPPTEIIAGQQIAFVDLITGRMRCAELGPPHGVIPWIIPRALLERCDFAPIRPDRDRGMDGYLVRGMRQSGARLRWRFHDPHSYARVDFKSDTNLNDYARMVALGLGHETGVCPWEALAAYYPAELVRLAREAHLYVRRSHDEASVSRDLPR